MCLILDKQRWQWPETLFNDRQLNEDLTIFCQRVNKAAPHLPDGRCLLFTMENIRRPILDQYKRRVA